MSKIYCSYSDCQEDWDEKKPCCACGEKNYLDCGNFKGNKEAIDKQTYDETATNDALRLPWHGNAMGASDFSWISMKRQPIIIGIIGQPSAGKTCLLATLYMLLRKGEKLGTYGFAGSNSLLGWEKLVAPMRFFGRHKVQFPPHTSSNTARLPGLLHLLLKDKNAQYQDVLFTDAPGEWFMAWAKNAEASQSKGAKWIYEYASAFVLVADTKALNQSIGENRQKLLAIAERMRNQAQNRPMLLVWTKADEAIEPTQKALIIEKVQKNLPNIATLDLAIINIQEQNAYLRQNVLEVFKTLLEQHARQKNKIPNIQIQDLNDFFFSIRANSYEQRT